VRVEIWSDVVCPWCYIGRRRFQKALASFQHGDSVEVVHRSFQLDPTAEPGGSRDAVEALSAKYGIPEAQARAAMARVEEVARVLAEGTFADAVRDDGLRAHALAATGVPFFVADRRYGVAGAQPPEVLCSMLQRAWDDAHPVELLSPGGDEACGEDGCAVR
jgi:predicted DsbA family dithiol-disulfide isomerase